MSPHVQPLHIRGIDWSVPRIKPEHFSRDDFMAVIKSVVDFPQGQDTSSPKTMGTPGVEFLWLDVACIDQRPQSPDGAAEVGRQAEIFRGAKRVFSWLTTFCKTDLDDILSNISIPSPLTPTQDAQLPRALGLIQKSLAILVKDPWFSSLWTLQEAFLRQDAIFIARDGRLPPKAHSSSFGNKLWYPFCVQGLEFTCRNLVHFINEQVWDPDSETTVEASAEHQALTRRIGLSPGWQSGNPLAAFVASGQRKTSCEADRVYGIQQVFGFRLGSTALEAPQRAFSRLELEVELGQQIIAKFPLMSQLYVTTKPVEFGHNWRISPDSITYVGVLDLEWNRNLNESTEADLSDSQTMETVHGNQRDKDALIQEARLVDDNTWGHFKGKTIRFNSLFACTEALTAELRDAASQDDPEGSDEAEEPMSLLILELDNSDFTAEWPNGWKGTDDWVDEGEGCKWLANNFPEDDLIVLGLSSFTTRAFGLILLRDHAYSAKGSVTYWRRLGYCEWWMTNLLNDQQLRPGSCLEEGMIEAWEGKYGPCLRVQSSDWVEIEGLFG
ncbi:hypothetical protein N0V82_004028 [Gnomoniopsis sp. IMI 355080]|nr:hypothetical protein N0V82_004028 [Gnomoniopsis sp. IMI 355080]